MSGIFYHHSFQRAFGTFPLKGNDLSAALESALAAGYRAIDTAQMYGNEADVGRVLAATSIARDELCVTTKVHPDNFGADKFMPSVEQSRRDLQLDVIDVLLLHWPPIGGDIEPSVKLLCEARDKGLARHVGVSNYTAAMLAKTKQVATEPIVTNQVEFHPLLDQSVLLKASAETGIPLSSYCSVARGEVLDNPVITEIAADLSVSPAQVVLRWILQKGVSINTMSTKPGNIEKNFDVMGFVLSNVDMARIDALGAANRRIVNAELVPWAPDFD